MGCGRQGCMMVASAFHWTQSHRWAWGRSTGQVSSEEGCGRCIRHGYACPKNINESKHVSNRVGDVSVSKTCPTWMQPPNRHVCASQCSATFLKIFFILFSFVNIYVFRLDLNEFMMCSIQNLFLDFNVMIFTDSKVHAKLF